MCAPTIKQTQIGRKLDLVAPQFTRMDIEMELPTALARVSRFNGHISRGIYSVAQHSVLGAEAFLTETGDAELALHFILHDAHEGYMGDISSPTLNGLAYFVEGEMEMPLGIVQKAMKKFKTLLDTAIYEALGLSLPNPEQIEAIKEMDIRMLRTERDFLLGKRFEWAPSVEAADPVTLDPSMFKPWHWEHAADAWFSLLQSLRDEVLYDEKSSSQAQA